MACVKIYVVHLRRKRMLCKSRIEKNMPTPLSPSAVETFRDHVVGIAARLFKEKGPAGFTMRELADRAGLSPMTAYRYFKDKEEILAAVRADAFDRFSQVMEAGFAAGSDAASRSNGAGEAYIRFAFENPEIYKLMFEISQKDEEYPELALAAERARATMTRHVDGLIAAGILKGDPKLIGHVFWAALHGIVMLKLANKLEPGYGFERIRDEMFRALTEGFG
jgi:AcrR family transcriptional regulator